MNIPSQEQSRRSRAHVNFPPKKPFSRKVKKEKKLLRPGLVLIPGFLSIEEQKAIVDECFSPSRLSSQIHAGSFYEYQDAGNGRKILKLNMGTRGRMIDSITSFPSFFRSLCNKAVNQAREFDKSMPAMNPTTMLINFYKPNANFKWHQDSEHPKRVRLGTGMPIVSFSIGLSADFGIKDRYKDVSHLCVRLKSGDAILFGGPSRMIVHSVLRVIPGTMPGYLQGVLRRGRLNLTIRDIPDGQLDTSQFPAYRVIYGESSNTVNTKARTKPKQFFQQQKNSNTKHTTIVKITPTKYKNN